MDVDHNVWFLEANLSPNMRKGVKKFETVFSKVVEDVMDIEFAIQFNGVL